MKNMIKNNKNPRYEKSITRCIICIEKYRIDSLALWKGKVWGSILANHRVNRFWSRIIILLTSPKSLRIILQMIYPNCWLIYFVPTACYKEPLPRAIFWMVSKNLSSHTLCTFSIADNVGITTQHIHVDMTLLYWKF